MLFPSLSRNVRRIAVACAFTFGLAAAHSASAAGTIALFAEPLQTASGTQYTQLTATGTFTGSGYPASAITFQVDGGQVIPAGCTAWGMTGICQVNYPTASLAVGAHTIKVSYAGDSGYSAATSTANLLVTGAGVNYVPMTVSSVETTYGVSTVPVSATVTVPSPLPQGLQQITFSIDGGATVLASCLLTNQGRANCTANMPVSGLREGYHSILFNVPSDSYYTAPQQSGNTLLLK